MTRCKIKRRSDNHGIFRKAKTIMRKTRLYTKQLADAVHLSKNSICNYEKNVNLPNIETLMSLADIFNVPVDYLLGRSAISFKFGKLNKSFFGKFTIAEAIDILLLLIKKAVK